MTPEEFLQLCKLKKDAGYNQILDYINAKGIFKSLKDEFGMNGLHLATKSENIKIVKLLVEKGMNPLIKDETKDQKTALTYAIERGSIDIISILLNAPSFKPIKTNKRYSEYTALAKNEKISIMDYKNILTKMINLGLDANSLDSKSMNVFLYCIKSENFERIQVCLDLKININNPDRPFLKFALYREPPNNKIIKMLIDNGVYLSSQEHNFNALHTAHYRDNLEIFEYLITHYDADKTLTEETLKEIIEHKETDFLKFLWKIPMVHDYITQHKLYNALPQDIQNIFIF